MCVRINAAGNDQAIGCIDDANTARHHEIRTGAHVTNDTILDVNVGRECFVMVHHLAAFNVETILRALRGISMEIC